MRFDTDITRITRAADGLRLHLKDGSTLDCDLVMYATGRKPNSAKLGLAACGVTLDDAGAVKVDGNYRSSVPSIYAIGDVTDRVNLTPVALAEGMALAWHLYRDHERPIDYEYVPSAVFSHPNLATVGYTVPRRARSSALSRSSNRASRRSSTPSRAARKRPS